MSRFLSGVTVVAARADGDVHGMTASAFLSVSLDPPLVLVSVAKSAKMHAILTNADRFSISILGAPQQALSGHFAGYGAAEVRWVEAGFETPVLHGAIGWIDCSKAAAHDAGDHSLFLGAVEKVVANDGEPLAYYRGKYRDLAPA